MPATITTTLTDNSKEWVDTLKKRFDEGGVAAEDFEETLEGVNKELGSRKAKEQADQLKQLADELDGTATAAAKLEQEERNASDAMGRQQQQIINKNAALRDLNVTTYAAAERAGTLSTYHRDLDKAMNEIKVREYKQEIDKLARSMSGLGAAEKKSTNSTFWIETAAKFNLAKEGFSWAQSAFRGIISYSQMMADKGNASFAKLTAAGAKFRDMLVDIGNSRQVMDLVHDLSQELEDSTPKLRDMFGSVLGATQGVINYSMEGWLKLAEATGVVHKGTMKALAEERQARDEASKKRFADNEKAIKYQKEMIALQKAEREAAVYNPGKAIQQGSARDDALANYKSTKELDASIARLKRQQQDAVKSVKARGGDPMQDRTVLEDGKELEMLERRRLELMKEQQAVAKARKTDIPRQMFENELALLDTVLAKHKSNSQQIESLEAQRQRLIDKRNAKDASPEEQRGIDDEIHDINQVIQQQQKKYDEIKKLETERERLVEENRKRERELAKDDADLDRINHEQEMARLKEKSDKAVEEANLKLQLEEELANVKKQKAEEDKNAHEKKIGQLKELLTLQGKPIPGMGGGMPSMMDQMKGMITPQQVQRKIVKNREDKAEENWRKNNADKLDAKGNLIDTTGEFDGRSDADRNRILRARQKSQIAAAKQGARAGARKDMNNGALSNEEVAGAQGELLAGVSENLVKKGNLNESQVDAIRQVVDELASQNSQSAQLQDQLNGIKRAISKLRRPSGNKEDSF